MAAEFVVRGSLRFTSCTWGGASDGCASVGKVGREGLIMLCGALRMGSAAMLGAWRAVFAAVLNGAALAAEPKDLSPRLCIRVRETVRTHETTHMYAYAQGALL